MKLKKNSLKVKIWLYLAIFSILILLFLWLFQIIFLDSYYEASKRKDLNAATASIKKMTEKSSTLETTDIDALARDKEICIEIISSNNVLYDSAMYNRGCLPDKNTNNYKQLFISSNNENETYKLVNPRYNNEVLINALKVGNYSYIFISTSLEPLSRTISILQSQLIIVTFVVLSVSFVVAYYISRYISKPIVEINTAAKKLASGDYESKFYIDDDIHELNELSSTLNNMRIELGKTEELRRELMANISHDLKTPLTMIRSYAEMVRDLTYKDKVKREDNLNVIIEESERLNLLVNDMLDISVLQSGTIKLNLETFNISDLVKEIFKTFEILTSKEKYKFIFEGSDEIIIKGDKKRLYQAIYNLVNNAINYTGKDNTVTVRILDYDNKIKIEIIDTGKGIKEEDLSLIWKKYYKTNKHHNRGKIGTGIGLSIVENIFKAHAYDYGVSSKLNEGTTFWFEICKEDK